MTKHFDQRMNQRGVPRSLVDFILLHGSWDGDRCVLDKKALRALIEGFDNMRRTAVRAMDKGGMVVVEAGGREVTVYPMLPRRRRKH